MIGVVAKETEKEIVEEFFQLFKTPWEFFHETGRYEVMIVSDSEIIEGLATLTLVFASRELSFDTENDLNPRLEAKNSMAQYHRFRFPIYGSLLSFAKGTAAGLKGTETDESIAVQLEKKNKRVVRIGYDLFYEIGFLLKKGQPVEHAGVPTLEHHIDVLRQFIVGAGIFLIEIPPVPFGYDFIVCLTHDVDFVGIRRHFLDRTFLGFVYRASIASLIAAFKGRIRAKAVVRNWYTLLLLPFVFLGLRKDFWDGFERYLRIEGNLPSTFFFIASKNDPGRLGDQSAPKTRAAPYEISEISNQIRLLLKQGREIGLHGIDAWIDSIKGHREKEAVSLATACSEVGVRMHWLFFDALSPRRLAEAGFFYDSTVGYNETMGFRSGTVQSYKVPNTNGPSELPLNIMDTALFYPSRMNLSDHQAWEKVQEVVNWFEHFGGVLSVNWHLRSIAPERLWDDFYMRLVQDLRRRQVWFATGRRAASWFRERRMLSFKDVSTLGDTISINLSGLSETYGPGLTLRCYGPCSKGNDSGSGLRVDEYRDIEIPNENGEAKIEIRAKNLIKHTKLSH